MPELPEVEIVRQSLSKNIKGKKINKVLVRNRNLRFKLNPYFENKLKDQFISKIQRFSKYIIIMLQNKSFCVIHLGMSGTIHVIKKKKKNSLTNTSFYQSPTLPKKHNHIEFFLKDIKLIYNDPRRFGFFLLIKDKKKLKNIFKNYGPEPFDKRFNLNYLKNFFKGKKKDIKGFLLDQKLVSGIAQQKCISLECGLQNGTLAIFVATMLFDDVAFLVPSGAYAITMYITGFIFIYILKKSN